MYKQKDKEVINQTIGNVIKIQKYNNLYNVLILDENNNYITYLDLKNMHLSKQDGVKSFSIFLETLNEVYR